MIGWEIGWEGGQRPLFSYLFFLFLYFFFGISFQFNFSVESIPFHFISFHSILAKTRLAGSLLPLLVLLLDVLLNVLQLANTLRFMVGHWQAPFADFRKQHEHIFLQDRSLEGLGPSPSPPPLSKPCKCFHFLFVFFFLANIHSEKSQKKKENWMESHDNVHQMSCAAI